MLRKFTLTPIKAKSKGEISRLRKEGFIPVSLQHKGAVTTHYQLAVQPLSEFILRHGDAGMVDLIIEPETATQKAIIQSVQRDPVSGKLIQATFQQIRKDDRLTTHVPISFTGEPADVVLSGAMVQHALTTLEIECAQDSLPSHITVALDHMVLGHAIRVSDLPVNPHFKIVTPGNMVIVSLTVNRAALPVPAVAV